LEIINFSNLKIEVSSDKLYELNSADNVKEYDYIYSSYNSVNKDYDIYAPKYGIIAKDEEIVLRSALLVAGGGGATAPHKRSALIDNDSLIVILGDSIFSMSLPDLSINWATVCEDCVTCFEIFNCIDGYIIHGEVSILKINKLGNVEWEFFGRDIFTTLDSVDDFKVYDNYIITKDWEYNEYKIDIKNGLEIK
jgi:hypothetical protein